MMIRHMCVDDRIRCLGIRARGLYCGMVDLLRVREAFLLSGEGERPRRFWILDFPRTKQRLVVCLHGGEISSEG